mmetsp:Transcript_16105/g.32422  ORF Transcript_16105/g.32422 Transcript_16105/m.32422 type:complete len:143 (-) Transcript_16105:356-784(-)
MGLFDATRITVAFAIVYSTALFLQIVTKQRVIIQHKNSNKPFDRYTSPSLRHVDRLVGNMIEWALVFLPLLWCLAVCDRLDTVAVRSSWMYVFCRAVYVILVMVHGVASSGRNKMLWISTLPAYGCLIVLMVKAVPLLWVET